MNFSKSILLFNSSIRVIETIYDLDPAPGERKERAKRTLYKTLDPSIKKDDLVKQINEYCDQYTPDNQVFIGETINPMLTYLTLNSSQWASKKIVEAVKEAGFVLFATASPRGTKQYFLVRDKSQTFHIVTDSAS